MRRSLVLPLTALVGAAVAVPVFFATVSSASTTSPTITPTTTTAPEEQGPDTAEDRYGVVRYDAAARKWAILSTPVFQGYGLTGVSCSSSTGVLTVGFSPLDTVGTFTVDEDEAYAGRYAAGAALTTKSMAITFRKPATGAVVSCNAAELRIANSGLQVWVRGSSVPPVSPSPSLPPPPVTGPVTGSPPPPSTPTPSSSPSDDSDPSNAVPPPLG